MTIDAPLRRWLRLPLALAVLCLLLSEVAVPPLARAVWEAEAGTLPASLEEAVAEKLAEGPLEIHMADLRSYLRWAAVACGVYALFLVLVNRRRLLRPALSSADALSLAGVRILVCGIALVNAFWEHLPSTALLPREMFDANGAVALAAALPGFDAFLVSPAALAVFQGATCLLLLAALVGWRTRWTLPAAALAVLLLGGLLRSYSRFFHTGLIPLYLLLILCVVPCADALSLDRRRGREPRRERDPEVYGWARFACWTALALPYLEAGLSKLRDGGWLWWHPTNLQAIILRDNLQPMEFDFGIGLALMEAPPWVFAALGLSALLVELLYPSVLFSRTARLLLPAAAALLHLGIWLLQNVLFLDLILLQAMFVDFRPVLAAVGRRTGGEVTPTASTPSRRSGAGLGDLAVPTALRGLAFVLLFAWAVRTELYPLSAMEMYAERNRDGTVEWVRPLGVWESGRVTRAPLEATIPALRDGRHRWTLQELFGPEGRDRRAAETFLRRVLSVHNREVPVGEALAAIRVERRRCRVGDAVGPLEAGELGDVVATVELTAIAGR